MSERADYGLDAPYVVRNLSIASIAGLALWSSAAVFHLWSGRIGPFILPGMGLGVGLGTGFMAFWMWYSSRYGKVREREGLLDAIAWRGDEQVLDVGCGRGLMLIGAAKRLTTGKATGIDIWQTEDLSGNKMEATVENARREGVADRVTVTTADMRKIPLPDASIDVVVSRAAIHNLYEKVDRAAAIAAIARVLKPGGRAIIDDIRHGAEYTQVFAANGCDVRRLDSKIGSALWTVITFGSLQPARLLATKSPSPGLRPPSPR
jgi:arsenite methyltransferase